MIYDGERRPVVAHRRSALDAGAAAIPRGAALSLGVQILPEAWTVIQRPPRRRDRARRRRARGPGRCSALRRKQDAALARPRGRPLPLRRPRGHPGARRRPGRPARAAPRRQPGRLGAGLPLRSPRGPARSDPNVLFILVDTLRRDHLTPYGYRRHTTPEIAALAGRARRRGRGGLQPGAVDPAVRGLVPDRPPSRRAAGRGHGRPSASRPESSPWPSGWPGSGYETGGFVANPTLHAGAGFDRGFRTFFAPPADVEWMQQRTPTTLNAPRRPLARAPSQRPAVLRSTSTTSTRTTRTTTRTSIDAAGARRSCPATRARWPATGSTASTPASSSSPTRSGTCPTSGRSTTARCATSTATSASCWRRSTRRCSPNTLIVLTADHGEELYDHGGWKHGQTPLRGADPRAADRPLGRPHPGRARGCAGTVRLAGPRADPGRGRGRWKADPEWDGVDLLPALTGKASRCRGSPPSPST